MILLNVVFVGKGSHYSRNKQMMRKGNLNQINKLIQCKEVVTITVSHTIFGQQETS